jgi:predicted aldo/keto reductase-like oxidoreductase
MRLPTRGVQQEIDEPNAIGMIRHAIDAGVNYVDTAWPYHGKMSESLVGKALKDGYLSRVKIATKLPTWLVNEPADFDRYFNEQLAKLQTDRIDMYLLHALGKKSWEKIRGQGVLEWAARQKENGRIGWIGFSFHDDYPAFQEIVDAWDGWTFCQIQYNYMNTATQAGTKGLLHAAAKGLAVVIMEPLLGGGLSNPPPAIQSLWDTAARKRSPSEWALQWVWNKPEVSVVLSGMTAMTQLEENLVAAERSGAGSMSTAEEELIGHVAAAYEGLRPIIEHIDNPGALLEHCARLCRPADGGEARHRRGWRTWEDDDVEPCRVHPARGEREADVPPRRREYRPRRPRRMGRG